MTAETAFKKRWRQFDKMISFFPDELQYDLIQWRDSFARTAESAAKKEEKEWGKNGYSHAFRLASPEKKEEKKQ